MVSYRATYQCQEAGGVDCASMPLAAILPLPVVGFITVPHTIVSAVLMAERSCTKAKFICSRVVSTHVMVNCEFVCVELGHS